MTRFARAGKRKFLEASNWDDLSSNKPTAEALPSNKDGHLPRKKKTLSKSKKNIKSEKLVSDPKRQKQIEARRLRRMKQKLCFLCRERGHKASECPNKNDNMNIGSCFKCGYSNHTAKKCKADIDEKSAGAFPFAKCFICQEKGHLARSCPENPRGLYPQGGGCKICGSVEHLKRDCPKLVRIKSRGNSLDSISLTMIEPLTHNSADAQDTLKTETPRQKKKHGKGKEKVINF